MMRRPYIDPSDLSLPHTLGLPGEMSGTRASDAERDRAADALRTTMPTAGSARTSSRNARAARTPQRRSAIWISCSRTCRGCARLRASGRRGGSGYGRRRSRSRSSRRCFAVAVAASAHALFFVWPLMFFLFLRFAFMHRRWWGRVRSWPEGYRHY